LGFRWRRMYHWF